MAKSLKIMMAKVGLAKVGLSRGTGLERWNGCAGLWLAPNGPAVGSSLAHVAGVSRPSKHEATEPTWGVAHGPLAPNPPKLEMNSILCVP